MIKRLEEFRVDEVVCIPGGAVSILDAGARAVVVPVVTVDDDSLPSDVMTSEAEVVVVERAVTADDLVEVASDPAVEAHLVVSVAPQIAAEAVQARVPLLEDDGLSLNLADLLSNDPLGHLLEDNQTLLDDLDSLRAADELLLLLHDYLLEARTIEVIGSVEVIEVVQGVEASPVVEGTVASDS